MAGTLYLCGTPIGNLEDASARLLRVLGEVDVIAAEDTRHTLKLLTHFHIATPLTSYHQHNMATKGPELVAQLARGQSIALVSDAGMPAISDPGEDLVRLCHAAGVTVTSVPSATALTTALALSGLPTKKFIFEGFLPRNNRDRTDVLAQLTHHRHTLVFYESPHHLHKTLTHLHTVFGNRRVCLVREITKKFEQVQHFTLEDAVAFVGAHEPKGEYVVLVAGLSKDDVQAQQADKLASTTIEQHMNEFLQAGYDQKAAMKAVAKARGVSKSVIYAYLN